MLSAYLLTAQHPHSKSLVKLGAQMEGFKLLHLPLTITLSHFASVRFLTGAFAAVAGLYLTILVLDCSSLNAALPLHPPLPSVGASNGWGRGCQQIDRIAISKGARRRAGVARRPGGDRARPGLAAPGLHRA